jgi:hypothetical protein
MDKYRLVSQKYQIYESSISKFEDFNKFVTGQYMNDFLQLESPNETKLQKTMCFIQDHTQVLYIRQKKGKELLTQLTDAFNNHSCPDEDPSANRFESAEFLFDKMLDTTEAIVSRLELFVNKRITMGSVLNTLQTEGQESFGFSSQTLTYPILPHYPQFIKDYLNTGTVFHKWQYNRDALESQDPSMLDLKEVFYQLAQPMLSFNVEFSQKLKTDQFYTTSPFYSQLGLLAPSIMNDEYLKEYRFHMMNKIQSDVVFSTYIGHIYSTPSLYEKSDF